MLEERSMCSLTSGQLGFQCSLSLHGSYIDSSQVCSASPGSTGCSLVFFLTYEKEGEKKQFESILLSPVSVWPVETSLLSVTGHCQLSLCFIFIFLLYHRAHTKHKDGTGANCTTVLLTHFHL